MKQQQQPSELQAAGIDTQLVLRAAGHPSPFTYIIVDRAGRVGGWVGGLGRQADMS